jgi:tRNA (adenine-N(1)-)-methyltransferase non-catalytic subunit
LSGLFDVSILLSLVRDRSAKIQRGQCKLDAIIGAPHGSYFQVDRNQLIRIDSKPQLRADDDIVTAANNKDLLDDNTAQKLSKEEIDEMKKTGKSGEEIIRALVDNSDTFKTKTVFSQEKYLKKKQKKYGLPIHFFGLTVRGLQASSFHSSALSVGGQPRALLRVQEPSEDHLS